MLLLLEDRHKEHLQLVSSISADVLQELLELSVKNFQDGEDIEEYQKLSDKLNIEKTKLEQTIQSMMYLLSESSKIMISEIDFHDSLLTLGYREETRAQFQTTYLNNRIAIRKILQEINLHPAQYQDLEWRVQVKLASRSLRGQITPSVLMRLHTTEGGSNHSRTLLCDIPNLINLADTLETALQESKSQHTRRILRNIK